MHASDYLRRLTITRISLCRGGSVLETMLVLAVVALMVLVVLDRSITLRVEAERTALDAVVQALRTAALEHGIQRRVGDDSNAAQPPVINPMLWLERPPLNYLGELAGPDPATITGGQWYFDTASRLLVYRVDHEAYFESTLPGAARVLFKVVSDSADTDREASSSVTVEVVEPYFWRRHPVSFSALRIWGVLGAAP